MLKKLMQKMMMLAALVFASVPLSHATTGLSQSSMTAAFITSAGAQPIPAFLVRRNESVFAVINSTNLLMHGTTINIEASSNMQNWAVVATTASGALGNIGFSSFTFPTVSQDTFYRFNVLASSDGPLFLTFRDNDDFVVGLKSNKGLDSAYFNDDSLNVLGTLKPNRFQYQQSGSSLTPAGPPVIMTISSTTQFCLGQTPTVDKVLFSTNIIQLETNFVPIQYASVSSATLQALPVISTQTAQNGDTITFLVMNSTIAFNSSSVSANSGLKLGADVRSLGNGDVLQLMFFNGFWRELLYVDNRE